MRHQQSEAVAQSDMSRNLPWDAWIQQGLNNIREKQLERVLRPLIPTASPVEVGLLLVL